MVIVWSLRFMVLLFISVRIVGRSLCIWGILSGIFVFIWGRSFFCVVSVVRFFLIWWFVRFMRRCIVF